MVLSRPQQRWVPRANGVGAVGEGLLVAPDAEIEAELTGEVIAEVIISRNL